MAVSIKDMYIWRAACHNGTLIPEIDEKQPEGRGFAEVEPGQVKLLELLALQLRPMRWEPAHHVIVPEGAEPVFFRRRRVELDPSTDWQKTTTTHCIGWKRQGIGCYLFVHEDGTTLMTSDPQAV